MSTDNAQPFINEKEALEYFVEGLRRASSRAKEMGRLQNHEIWMDISKICEEMLLSGVMIAESRPMGRMEVLAMINRREKRMGAKRDAEANPKPKLIMP